MVKHIITLVAIALVLVGKTATAQLYDYPDDSFKNQHVYHVALMVPLYLEQVTEEFWDEAPNNKMLLTKPFSFLHFYEGFMIAADSMANSRGMKLELKVYDVDNDVNKAVEAIADPWLANADMIVGPFYIKPFEKVMKFASDNDILIVNPITQRSNIIDNQPNVIKVKPSFDSQIDQLEMLIRDYYHSNSIFIISKDGVGDADMISRINEIAERHMDSLSYVGNREVVKVIKKHQTRWKFLNVEFEEFDYHTDSRHLDISSLKEAIDDSTAFANRIININYDRDSLKIVSEYASTMRNNLFVVYGNDKLFANEIVNKVTKLTEYFPLTVVMMPEWSKFDRLFNENLMKMKAIYMDDNYIDYQSIRVMSFIKKFRDRYGTEPQAYAYQGFDICWYFLNALNDYGREFTAHLEGYNIPLLHSEFHFERKNENSGFENRFWNVYQFKGYNKMIIKPLLRQSDSEETNGYEMKGVFYDER